MTDSGSSAGLTLPPLPPENASEGELKRHAIMLDRLKFELEREKFLSQRSDLLAKLPIIVTAIAGVSAILFQGAGLWTASLQRAAAADELQAKQVSQRADYDLKALDFLVKNSDGLIGCNSADGSDSAALQSLGEFMSEPGKRVLQAAIYRAVSKCAAASQKHASDEASASGRTPAPAELQEARYQEIVRQAPILSASAALVPDGAQLPSVFIHYSSDADRDRATTVQAALKAKGYKAPGTERVSVAPRVLQVRFYKDDQRPAAERLAELLKAQLGTMPELRSLQHDYPKLPSGVMEIWFPAKG